MANVLNFECLEVTGSSRNEAYEKAPFSIMGDVTLSYRKWRTEQTEAITEAKKQEFYQSILDTRSHNVPGVGFAIRIESPKLDTREHPWTIRNVKNENGARKFTKVYQLIDKDTQQILGEATTSKTQAKDLGKKLIANGFRGKIKCVITKQVTEGEPLAFEMEYTQSKGARQGTWIVFGLKK